jgi:hypothetical protein
MYKNLQADLCNKLSKLPGYTTHRMRNAADKDVLVFVEFDVPTNALDTVEEFAHGGFRIRSSASVGRVAMARDDGKGISPREQRIQAAGQARHSEDNGESIDRKKRRRSPSPSRSESQDRVTRTGNPIRIQIRKRN